MKATYVHGSILRHILIMTGSGTIGLAALFVVDLVDMYFLSLLGDVNITAAIGYAASILFFTLSINIGLSIGCGALVSRMAGKGDRESAKRLVAHIFLTCVLFSVVTVLLIVLNAERLLGWLGASGQALIFAKQYLLIVIASMPIMAIAMATSAVTRALGDAKNAMALTLLGAAVNAALDPIFIFVLDMGIQGAATATVCARIAMFGYGVWIVMHKFHLLGKIQLSAYIDDAKLYFKIALPAVLTNLATPISIAYITAVMADFGDSAVSGNAIVARIQQVAFAGLFALSGAIGPIAGQNWGAQQFARVRETVNKSLFIVFVYCAIVCLALFLGTEFLVAMFKAEGQEANLIRWFCWGMSTIYLFHGATFATNALFNNLGVAHVATQFNFGKATFGTMPFVYFGAQWGGPEGIYVGALVGAAIVAALGVWATYRHLRKLPELEY